MEPDRFEEVRRTASRLGGRLAASVGAARTEDDAAQTNGHVAATGAGAVHGEHALTWWYNSIVSNSIKSRFFEYLNYSPWKKC